jgi:hypothetical protein
MLPFTVPLAEVHPIECSTPLLLVHAMKGGACLSSERISATVREPTRTAGIFALYTFLILPAAGASDGAKPPRQSA